MSIKNVMFDIYQTVATIDLDHEEANKSHAWNILADFIRYKYSIEVSGSELEEKRDQQIELFYTQIGGEDLHYEFVDIFQKVFKENWSITLTTEESKELVMLYRIIGRGYLQAYKEVKDLIRTIKSEGKKVYAVSYTQRSYTEEELIELELWDLFDGSCFSSDISKKKKHQQFYSDVLEELKLSPEETVMIGDNYHDDVLAPRKVGLNSIWLNNPISSHKYDVPGSEKYQAELAKAHTILELIHSL